MTWAEMYNLRSCFALHFLQISSHIIHIGKNQFTTHYKSDVV